MASINDVFWVEVDPEGNLKSILLNWEASQPEEGWSCIPVTLAPKPQDVEIPSNLSPRETRLLICDLVEPYLDRCACSEDVDVGLHREVVAASRKYAAGDVSGAELSALKEKAEASFPDIAYPDGDLALAGAVFAAASPDEEMGQLGLVQFVVTSMWRWVGHCERMKRPDDGSAYARACVMLAMQQREIIANRTRDGGR